MTHGSLFSGIGGFDLAAEWMGWKNAFHCEWNEFGRRVLSHYWPDAMSYNDIKNADFTIWRGRIDILTGGFPCQPFSSAGQRKGTDDDRYLWPQMLRCIRQVQPRYVVGENVDGIFTWSEGMVFETVCTDLENEGYEVQAVRIPACATGAPHRRDRWWFVGHAKHDGRFTTKNGQSSFERSNGNKARPHQFQQPTGPAISRNLANYPTSEGLSQSRQADFQQFPTETEKGVDNRLKQPNCDATINGNKGLQMAKFGRTPCEGKRTPRPIAQRFENEHWVEAATRLCVLDDGLSGRLDAEALSTKPQHAAGKWRKESLKAAGNAIVPQVAYQIFKAIEEVENILNLNP